jgi:hypothetical protein
MNFQLRARAPVEGGALIILAEMDGDKSGSGVEVEGELIDGVGVGR